MVDDPRRKMDDEGEGKKSSKSISFHQCNIETIIGIAIVAIINDHTDTWHQSPGVDGVEQKSWRQL